MNITEIYSNTHRIKCKKTKQGSEDKETNKQTKTKQLQSVSTNVIFAWCYLTIIISSGCIGEIHN